MHVKILISSPNRKKFLIRIQSLYSGRGFIFTSSLSSGNILQNVTSSLQLLNSCVNQKVYSGNAQSPFHTCMWSKDVNIKKLTRTVVKRYKINIFTVLHFAASDLNWRLKYLLNIKKDHWFPLFNYLLRKMFNVVQWCCSFCFKHITIILNWF